MVSTVSRKQAKPNSKSIYRFLGSQDYMMLNANDIRLLYMESNVSAHAPGLDTDALHEDASRKLEK